MIVSGECLTVCLLLIIPVLYEISSTFRYYLKFFVYYLIVMLTSVYVIPIMLCRPRDVKNLILASMLCRHITRILGLHWELRGKEYLERDEAFVIVANHQSSLDILGMFELWPVMRKCTVVAKKELFYAWPFGIAAWLCGLIFIDRLNSETSKEVINSSIDQLKKDKIFFMHAVLFSEDFPLSVHIWIIFSVCSIKVKLWVFPEGTRKNTGEIHSFKKGAFHVAVRERMPLLPIVFTQFYFLQGSPKQLDMGRVIMTVLPPVSTEGLTAADVPRLMEETRTAMVTTFHSTSTKLKGEVMAHYKAH